jgi:hypothetical protein
VIFDLEASLLLADNKQELFKLSENNHIFTRLRVYYKIPPAKAGHIDHILPVRFQIAYITYQEALDSDLWWSA